MMDTILAQEGRRASPRRGSGRKAFPTAALGLRRNCHASHDASDAPIILLSWR